MPIDPNNLSSSAVLTFDDEFNSLSLWNGSSGVWATSFWYDNPNGNGSTLAGNGEQEWYINSNYGPTASLTPWTVDSNGILHLTASRTPSNLLSAVNGYAYVSGEINTYHSFSQTYGYFEIKAELPSGQGVWPAFWLLPESGAWPPELDVMEVLGANPNQLVTTVHTNETGRPTQSAQATTVADTSHGYHTYGVDWEADYITWYFDGVAVYRAPTPTDMHSPMYMILNLALGGYWGGAVGASTAFPADYKIDYVRAYQSLAAAAASPTPPLIVDGSASAPKPPTAGAPAGPMLPSGDGLSASGASVTLATSGAVVDAALQNGKLILSEAVDGGWGSHTGAAAIFDNTGAIIGGGITLGGYASQGAAMQPQITLLEGGFWRVDYAGAGAPGGYEIYNDAGKQVFVDNAYTTGSPTFTGLLNGAYLSTNNGWSGRFAVTESNGNVDWINLPVIAGQATTPTSITPLGDGGFAFAFAGSTELDRFSFNGGVHTVLTLSAPVASGTPSLAAVAGYGLAAAWLTSAGGAQTHLEVQTFDAQGGAVSAAVSVAAIANPSQAAATLIATGAGNQTAVVWSDGGALSVAAVNGGSAGAPVALGAADLAHATETVLSNGRVAITYATLVGSAQHLIVAVFDASLDAIVSRTDLGASDGHVHVVATGSGGLALSWQSSGAYMGAAYDGQGHWGATTPVAGNFLGVSADGLIVAVGLNATGQEVMQHYSLSPDAGATPVASGPSVPGTPTQSTPSPAVTVVTDTAAHLSASLNALQSNASLTSIVVSDNQAVTISLSQLNADAHVLSLLSQANGASATLKIADTAANLGANLDALNAKAQVSGLIATDNAALSVSAASLLADSRLLSSARTGAGVLEAITVNDTAAALSQALGAIVANAQVSLVTVTDGQPLCLSVLQITADAAALGKISGGYTLSVTDTAADLAAALSKLQANSHVKALVICDMAPIHLTSAQFSADAAILAKLSGAHTLTVAGAGTTGASYIYDASSKLVEEIVSARSSHMVYALASGLNIASPTVTGAISLGASGETLNFSQSFASTTVTGYQPGSDTVDIDHHLFTSFADMMAHATQSPSGVSLHSGTHTISFAGMTLAGLSGHSSDFHFV